MIIAKCLTQSDGLLGCEQEKQLLEVESDQPLPALHHRKPEDSRAMATKTGIKKDDLLLMSHN